MLEIMCSKREDKQEWKKEMVLFSFLFLFFGNFDSNFKPCADGIQLAHLDSLMVQCVKNLTRILVCFLLSDIILGYLPFMTLQKKLHVAKICYIYENNNKELIPHVDTRFSVKNLVSTWLNDNWTPHFMKFNSKEVRSIEII